MQRMRGKLRHQCMQHQQRPESGACPPPWASARQQLPLAGLPDGAPG